MECDKRLICLSQKKKIQNEKEKHTFGNSGLLVWCETVSSKRHKYKTETEEPKTKDNQNYHKSPVNISNHHGNVV